MIDFIFFYFSATFFSLAVESVLNKKSKAFDVFQVFLIIISVLLLILWAFD